MEYIENLDLATLIAIVILSFYVIFAIAIFIYRNTHLSHFYSIEKRALKNLINGEKLPFDSYLKSCEGDSKRLTFFLNESNKILTEGMTWLNIIASTSPFIGLFGTVISIFLTLISLDGSADISKISVPVGHALIATAAGIISAVLAYTFHLILKRKSFECFNILDAEKKILENE